MNKEQILPIRDNQGNLIAFHIYDMETRQTIMYSCQKMGFDDVKNLYDGISRAVEEDHNKDD